MGAQPEVMEIVKKYKMPIQPLNYYNFCDLVSAASDYYDLPENDIINYYNKLLDYLNCDTVF